MISAWGVDHGQDVSKAFSMGVIGAGAKTLGGQLKAIGIKGTGSLATGAKVGQRFGAKAGVGAAGRGLGRTVRNNKLGAGAIAGTGAAGAGALGYKKARD